MGFRLAIYISQPQRKKTIENNNNQQKPDSRKVSQLQFFTTARSRMACGSETHISRVEGAMSGAAKFEDIGNI
jgi:hypothetical protein